MKFRGPIFFSIALVALFIGVSAYLPTPNNAQKEAILIQRLLGGLNQLHYKPVDIDDTFSEKAFDLYIDRLDSGKRWLTQEDIEMLKEYRTKIDDEADKGTYEFMDLSLELLEKGIAKSKTYYEELVKNPVALSSDNVIELDGDKKTFAKNDEELKAYWAEMVQFEMITELADKIKSQEEGTEELKDKSRDQLLDEAREDVLEDYEAWYKRLKKRKRSDYLSIYLNALTNIYDPHTSYYAPKDKETFDIRMSGRLEGIGAQLSSDGDNTVVTRIIPGGPAWKGKDLEEKDVITKVAQKDAEAIVITGMRLDDVVQQIRGKKGTEVTLTIKKVDGTVEEIIIVRDVVELEESFAKSVIFDSPEKVNNIGYIKLPQFYADFSRRNGRSCAKDIAIELEKLKANNVNGIILDLRNNGGGSLRDVQRMSGFFIEEGPIVQVKARDNSPEILEDNDPKVQYDGPLIVMVNSFSASASEILAAALQDYGRAVIVGSNATFGKGTVQRFIDLDQGFRGDSDITPLGDLKLTIQKFYRINGGSTQLRGVTPDVVLPDRYHFFELGERENEYAMEWSEIKPVKYHQSVSSLDKLDNIKAASAARVKSNASFQKVLEQAKYVKERSDKTSQPLNLEKYQDERKKAIAKSDEYEDMFPTIESMSVKNLDVDLAAINIDEAKAEENKKWLEGMNKDIYIDEALSIMKDMIEKDN